MNPSLISEASIPTIAMQNAPTPASDIEPIAILGVITLENQPELAAKPEFITFPLKSSYPKITAQITQGLDFEESIVLRQQLFQFDINRLLILSKIIPECDLGGKPLENVIDLIKTTSSETVDFLLMLIQKIPPTNFEEIEATIKTIDAVPCEERVSVVDQSLSLIIDSLSYSQHSDIISIMAKMTASARESWVRLWTKMRGDGSSGVHFNPKDFCDKKFWNTHELSSAIDAALPLITDKEDVSNNLRILKAVLTIPLQQRESVVIQTLQLVGNRAEDYDIIVELAKIPPEQISSVVSQITTLLGNSRNYFTIINLIQAMKDLPMDQRETLVEQTLLLHRDEKDDEVYEIVEALAAIPPEQRNSVVNQTIPLVQNRKNWECYEIVEVLNAVAEIPHQQQESIVKQILLFKEEDWSSCEIRRAITALTEIPQEQRDLVVSHAELLMCVWDGHDWAKVITALAVIPEEQRTSAVHHTLSLERSQDSYRISINLVNAVNRLKNRNNTQQRGA
ncbi:MAG: hypothetical protein Q8K75_06855 [Chlamydiales bacterium]|nr:hypothetical protein [Chlamydiales bacterium]